MEDNKPQGEEGKEERKINAKFDQALRRLTAIMGKDWEKPGKIERHELPAIMTRIVANKKEELYRKFEADYVALVEEKKKLNKTISEKEKEFKKVILEAKKEFLKKVEVTLSIVSKIDEIEQEYYRTLGEAIPPEEEAQPNEETPNL